MRPPPIDDTHPGRAAIERLESASTFGSMPPSTTRSRTRRSSDVVERVAVAVQDAGNVRDEEVLLPRQARGTVYNLVRLGLA